MREQGEALERSTVLVVSPVIVIVRASPEGIAHSIVVAIDMAARDIDLQRFVFGQLVRETLCIGTSITIIGVYHIVYPEGIAIADIGNDIQSLMQLHGIVVIVAPHLPVPSKAIQVERGPFLDGTFYHNIHHITVAGKDTRRIVHVVVCIDAQPGGDVSCYGVRFVELHAELLGLIALPLCFAVYKVGLGPNTIAHLQHQLLQGGRQCLIVGIFLDIVHRHTGVGILQGGASGIGEESIQRTGIVLGLIIIILLAELVESLPVGSQIIVRHRRYFGHRPLGGTGTKIPSDNAPLR